MKRLNQNPWLGLKAYNEGSTLYGRDEDTINLAQLVFLFIILTLNHIWLIQLYHKHFGKCFVNDDGHVYSLILLPHNRVQGIFP